MNKNTTSPKLHSLPDRLIELAEFLRRCGRAVLEPKYIKESYMDRAATVEEALSIIRRTGQSDEVV